MAMRYVDLPCTVLHLISLLAILLFASSFVNDSWDDPRIYHLLSTCSHSPIHLRGSLNLWFGRRMIQASRQGRLLSVDDNLSSTR